MKKKKSRTRQTKYLYYLYCLKTKSVYENFQTYDIQAYRCASYNNPMLNRILEFCCFFAIFTPSDQQAYKGLPSCITSTPHHSLY